MRFGGFCAGNDELLLFQRCFEFIILLTIKKLIGLLFC